MDLLMVSIIYLSDKNSEVLEVKIPFIFSIQILIMVIMLWTQDCSLSLLAYRRTQYAEMPCPLGLGGAG